MTTNYTTLIQKFRQQRNPPRGSGAQVPMPTGATTGTSFPLSPTPPQPAAPVQTTPHYAPPVVGNLVLPWRTIFFAVALLCGAALLLVAILDGDVRLFQSQVPTAAPTAAQPVVYVERVVTATAQPTAPPSPPTVVVASAPPVYAQPARPAQPDQRAPVRSMPTPTVAPAVAWPAPATGTANGRMGYQCADGRYFPADDGRWGMFGFGQWIADGQGDMIDIRDSADAGDGKLGWHYKCQRVWR